MASRNIEVKILGDSRGYSKALNQSEGMTKRFGKAVDETGHRVHSLHLSLIGATAALVGGAGLEMGLKAIVDAAKRAQESQDRLNVTMKDAGLSYAAARKEVESHIDALSRLSAFQKSDLRDSFGALVRVTKDSADAMKLNSLAADIARGRHIDLATATNLVIKANMGMVGPLKRMGIEITPVKDAVNALTDSHKKFTTAQKDAAKALDLQATKLKAIDELTRTYSGSAKAYGNSAAGASDKFKVALQNLEVQVGDALLPTLTKYLKKAADWLTQLEKSGKLQRDVNGVVKTASGIIGDLTPVVKGAANAAERFAKAVGGWKDAAEIVLSGLLAAKLLKVSAAIRDIGVAAGIASGEKGVGGLLGMLLKIGGPGVLGGLGLAAAGAAAIGYSIYQDSQQTTSFAIPGSSNKHIELKNGQYTEVTHTAGRGGSAFKRTPITAAQAASLTGNPALGATGGGGSSGSETAASPGRSGAAGGSRSYGYSALRSLWNGAGGNSAVSDIMAAIALAESSGRSDAKGGPNTNGTFDYGCWQINSSHGYDPASLLAPDQTFNARCAVSVYNSQGLGAWSTYNSGAYQRYLQGGSTGGSKTPGTTGMTAADIVAQGTSKTKKTPWKGATQATIITARGAVTATLKGLPKDLDPIEKNAVDHIDALKKKLVPHMTAADYAKTEVELKKWGKKLHDEITKNAGIAAAAAAEAKKRFDRALSLDVSHILRDFDRQFADVKTKFDKETAAGLASRAAPAQTPEEKALADFQANRAAVDLAKSRADALANASTDEERAALALGFSLDDQETALQAAADASRVAADKKAADDQQSYQDQRDQAWQAMQDINDDQKIALQNNLDDWTANLEAKKKSWSDFVAWLQANGFDTGGLVNPNSGTITSPPSSGTIPRPGHAIPMAAGGSGRAIGPTLFYSAGNEDFAFSGEGRSFGGGSREIHTHVYLNGREIFKQVQKEAALDVKRGGSGVPG